MELVPTLANSLAICFLQDQGLTVEITYLEATLRKSPAAAQNLSGSSMDE